MGQSQQEQVHLCPPANSGPGRTFLMGLPYLLGDSDPRDPVKGWAKTWEYLAGARRAHRILPDRHRPGDEGTRRGHPRHHRLDDRLGYQPARARHCPGRSQGQKLEGFHWVTDAHYAVIPKGVSDEKIAVLLDVLNYMLQPKQQAIAYDAGYFYPGPAVKDVTIEMAPQESQDTIKEFGRPEYADWIANNPLEVPLEPKLMVQAFRIWDEKIGAKKG
jgi:putative spermidine/putrescine transport system substrate-binding protein